MAPPTPTPCPFCAIAASSPPSLLFPLPPPNPPTNNPSQPPPPQQQQQQQQPQPPNPPHLLLSTPTLLAFLDHAPISRGHVLLATRAHREKLSDVTVAEGRALGAWLPAVSRAVVNAVREGMDQDRDRENGGGGAGDWNVVQNNGVRAAQVVPHVHFHIIPRTADVPEVKARSWTMFGKGQREDLDEEDAAVLVGRMREGLEGEVEGVRRREGERGVRGLFEDEGGRGGSKL